MGKEIKKAVFKEEKDFDKLPDAIIVCVGCGLNAIGAFHPFINDKEVALCGAEAAGKGVLALFDE